MNDPFTTYTQILTTNKPFGWEVKHLQEPRRRSKVALIQAFRIRQSHAKVIESVFPLKTTFTYSEGSNVYSHIAVG